MAEEFSSHPGKDMGLAQVELCWRTLTSALAVLPGSEKTDALQHVKFNDDDDDGSDICGCLVRAMSDIASVRCI